MPKCEIDEDDSEDGDVPESGSIDTMGMRGLEQSFPMDRGSSVIWDVSHERILAGYLL